MNRKNLERCENFSFLKSGGKRYLDASNVILLRKEKPSQNRLK